MYPIRPSVQLVSTGFHEHPDNRGVFVHLWVLDLLGGDHSAALFFNQLLWWHQTGTDGASKLDYERDGFLWLLRPDDGWHEECRLSQKQVRRIRSVLVSKGFVEHRRFKLNGAPTSAWRPLYDAIQSAIRPNPELPSEGKFLGSDPQGQVPIPYRDIKERDMSNRASDDEQTVFDAWVTATKKTAATRLDKTRLRLIRDALSTYPLTDVLDAVRGWENSPFHRGENDSGKVYNGLDLLLRNADKIEEFRDLARGPRIESRRNGNGRPPPAPPAEHRSNADRIGDEELRRRDEMHYRQYVLDQQAQGVDTSDWGVSV